MKKRKNRNETEEKEITALYSKIYRISEKTVKRKNKHEITEQMYNVVLKENKTKNERNNNRIYKEQREKRN